MVDFFIHNLKIFVEMFVNNKWRDRPMSNVQEFVRDSDNE